MRFRPSLARFLPIGAAVGPPLSYNASFIDDAEEKKNKKSERAVRVASSHSMSFTNASRNKIFETRARILAPHIFAVLFLFAISLLLPPSSPLLLFNLYISFALLFLFPCSTTLRVRESIDRGKILSFAAPTEDALHLAANSLSEIKLIFARPIPYVFHSCSIF